MNKNILKRCLDELQNKVPRLDYIRGMLETLYELEGGKVIVENLIPIFPNNTGTSLPPNPIVISEAQMLENETKVKLKSVEGIINKSVTME